MYAIMKRFSVRTIAQACAITCLSVSFSACQTGPKEMTTASGMSYLFVESNEGRKAALQDVVRFRATVTDSKDSVVFQTPANQEPALYQLNGNPDTPRLEEGMMLCAAGDSIIFKIPTAEVYGPATPPNLANEKELKVALRMVSVQTMEEFEADRQMKLKEKQDAEMVTVENFIANSGQSYQKTESGMYYLITEEGKGANPIDGSNVTVHYRGTLLDGTPFDASYDRGEPFNFELGRGMVIRGWDEGIKLLKKGGKATLIIPSNLAYGDQQRGPVIQPFSTLKFEVELVDFK